MTSFTEYDRYDGIGLAELVKTGELSPLQVCEAAIRRAEELNPRLNAIITPLYDFARQAAQRVPADAPFCGVPFLLKDVHHALKGVPMSSGSALLKDFIPAHDAEIVDRFKRAGLIVLGKTNTPEFKLAYYTEPTAFGPARNPWNPDHSPGGSSGGSAAAVAARIVPMASATDEGGSIRVPASYCGLFGLKPSRGRNPVGPDFDEEWDGMSTSHVITRSVRDSAAMLDAVCGPETGAPYGIAPAERSFSDELKVSPGTLRIGCCVRPAYGRKVHPECVLAAEKACKLLQELGHEVEEAVPAYEEEDAALNWCIVMIGNEAAMVDRLIQIHGASRVMGRIELTNRALYSVGKELKAVDFVKAKRRWRELGMIMARTLNRYDLLLTPTLGQPPVPVGSQTPGRVDQWSMKLVNSPAGKLLLSSRNLTRRVLAELIQNTLKGQMPFTLIANITGQPAMSVPLHWTREGLPVGVQFLGRYGGEATLLRLAAQLEQAAPWFDRTPSLE